MEKPFKDEEDMAEFDSALDAILDVQLIPEVANGAQLNSSASPCNSYAALSSDNRDARSSDQQAPVLDMALSTIFRAFSDDADDTQLRKAEETYNSLIAKEKHMVRKKKAFHVHPSVVKNDFRHCFPQMYMNTLNSGDFEKVQDYYHTFMKSSTKFVADHTHVDNSFGIPNLIEMYGPNLAIHYILGSSLMFPDLVMKTSGTRITTSPSWRGSRIEMDVEFRSTKMNDLPVDEWLPQASVLEARFRKVGSPVIPVSEVRQSRAHAVRQEEKDASRSHVGFLAVGSQAQKKRRVEAKKDISVSSTDTGTGRTAAQGCLNQPRIPVEYVHALCAKTTLLPVPLQLHTRGKITIFLDENNYIQLINLTVRQV